jgi:hypothetical protein
MTLGNYDQPITLSALRDPKVLADVIEALKVRELIREEIARSINEAAQRAVREAAVRQSWLDAGYDPDTLEQGPVQVTKVKVGEFYATPTPPKV